MTCDAGPVTWHGRWPSSPVWSRPCPCWRGWPPRARDGRVPLGPPSSRSLAGFLRTCGDLAQGRDDRDLGPVLRVQVGELPLVGHGLLEVGVLHDGPAADDLLGLGVRSVDAADLALTDHEVHGVLRAVQATAVEERALGGPLADVGVHRIE